MFGKVSLRVVILKIMIVFGRYIKDSERDLGFKIWMKMEIRM